MTGPGWFEAVLWGAALIGSLSGVGLMKRLGYRFGWTVKPRPDRWHRRPAALHGGLGFGLPLLAVLAIWLVHTLPESRLIWHAGAWAEPTLRLTLAAGAGAALMLVCGWWDDVWPLGPAVKLIAELAAASLFVHSGGALVFFNQPLLDILLTYVWIVGLVNAVNMLDNMDGLAAGTACASALGVMILSLLSGRNPPAIFMAALLAACLLGFLAYNRPPASIFMGDSGSLTVGFMLAVLTVPGSLNGGLAAPLDSSLGRWPQLLVPLALVAVFIFDFTLVTAMRLLAAVKVYVGGRDHSSHRLVRLGFSEPKTVRLLIGLALLGAAVAMPTALYPEQAAPLWAAYALGLLFFGAWLGYKTKLPETARAGPFRIRETLADLLVRRQSAAVVLDLVLAVICFYGAYLLRFEFRLEPFLREAMLRALPLVAASSLLALALAGGYRDDWRLTSAADLPRYALGVLLGSSLSLAVVTLFSRFGRGNSRAAFVIFGVLFFLAVAASRLGFRLLDAFAARHSTVADEAAPVLIYGTGRHERFWCEEIRNNPEYKGYRVLGFIASDEPVRGGRVLGLPVRGLDDWVNRLADRPEIWAAGELAGDQAAWLAGGWNPPAVLRRLELRLSVALPLQEEEPSKTPS